MAVNTIPERLTAFRVYIDGTSDAKAVADIQLPSFEPLTETVKGAGIAGEIETPTIGHFQSLKVTLNWRSISKDFLSLLRQKGQRLDCRGAIQEYDAATGNQVTTGVRVVVHGLPTKVDLGKFETGSPTDSSTDIEALYLKVDLNGKNIIEIDKMNYKCVIDGVDYLADIRTALGL